MSDRRWLLALCVGRTLMTLNFMTYAASLPVLRSAWEMSATAAGSVSTAFQLSYAVSLMTFSALADRRGARQVFLVSGVLSACSAMAFAAFARSYWSGLILFGLVALSQGGTYTTSIMLIADQYDRARRGAAVGWLIASACLGYALSLILSGAMLGRGGYPLAFWLTACGPALGIAVTWPALRATPNVVHRRSSGIGFGTAVLHNPQAMRLIVGYMFHNWEIVGLWAWAPAFLTASFLLSGSEGVQAVELGAYMSAGLQLTGLLASVSTGRLSDRVGRRAVLIAFAAMGAACSFVFGWLVSWPVGVVIAVGAVYGFVTLGDSPVLSTALTETVSPGYLGAALALRSFVGFGAGAVAPLVVGVILDATNPPGVTPTTWGWAFGVLGLGGLIATICAYRLQAPFSYARALGRGANDGGH